MKNKSLLIVVLVIVVVIVGYLAFSHSSQSSTVRIGAIYPLTGGLAATYGEPSQRSAQLAVDEINTAGGVNGQKLEIDFQDHKCDPKTAVSALQGLTGAGVRVFTSAACTGTVMAMEPILQDTKSVLMATPVSGAKLTGSSPTVFRNWGSDLDESKLFADQIVKAGYKKVAAIYEETDYAKGIVMGVQNFLKNAGVSIVTDSFQTGATDIRTQLTKLKASNPDLILLSPQTVTSGEVILSQMEELNFKPAHIFVNDNIIVTPLVSKHATILDGALGANYVITQNDKAQNMLKDYKAKYGQDCPQPSVCAAVYDTIYLLIDAIKAKGYDATAIESYLHGVNYPGVSGDISFNDKNDRIGTVYSLFQVKNGVAVPYQ